MEPVRVWVRPSAYTLYLYIFMFLWDSQKWELGEEISLILLPICGILFLLQDCLVQPWCEGLCLVLLSHFMPFFCWNSRENCFFVLEGNWWGLNLGEKEHGEDLEEGERRNCVQNLGDKHILYKNWITSQMIFKNKNTNKTKTEKQSFQQKIYKK